MRARRLRFGVSIRRASSGPEWAAKARRAEELGYSILLVADHLAAQLSPWTALTAAAAATDRLRVGTFVLNNDLRHPVLVAREAATLGLLSGGRFELGLGSGHMRREYREAGLPFDQGSVRAARLTESAHVIRRLLAGEEVTFEGAHYQVRGHRLTPPPESIPILIGGNRDEVLRAAAREADTAGLTGFTSRRGGTEQDTSTFTGAGLASRVRLLEESARERPDALELNALVQAVEVTPDREAVAAALASSGWDLPAEALLDSPFLMIGTHEQIADQVLGWRERFGISYWTVFEAAMEDFAPVVERLRDT